jgi:tetratricopeptide (TPR) repeat protein
MIGLAILIAALFMIPLTLRLTAKATGRKGETTRRLRWHGIQWDASADHDALVAQALAKQKSGDVLGALADYDLALLQKRTALVLNNRGCALLQSGEIERAITDLRAAVALEPDSATAHCSLAEAYARAGHDAAALESLKTAAALDPRWRAHARTAEEFARLRATPEGAKWLGDDEA